jgi:CheY-like chemotaxis protein
MSTLPIVILAEPDPLIRNVLRAEFTHWDFVVRLAATGQEAEDYATHAVAHLIVLDAKLQLGAYDACARIRRHPAYAARPIVLTTNKPSPRVKAAAGAAGVTVVLAKPYSVSDLFNAIRPFVTPDDVLFSPRAQGNGINPPKEWAPASVQTWQPGGNPALARNGKLLPVVRSQGVMLPLTRKP